MILRIIQKNAQVHKWTNITALEYSSDTLTIRGDYNNHTKAYAVYSINDLINIDMEF